MSESGIRASDRERQQTVRALRGQLREGRLSDVTFVRRLVLALDARRRTELDHLVADLPARTPVRRRLHSLYQRFVVEINQLIAPLTARRPVPAISELALPPVPGKYVIGRADDVDLCLDDISVSRRHALIAFLEGGWIVTDLGSRNGTWLNGWRLPGPAPIGPGDRLDLGSCRFVVADKSAKPIGATVVPLRRELPAQ